MGTNYSKDQLTIMVESSRLFLWTEYARTGCGTIETRGTDYKVWDALPVSAQYNHHHIAKAKMHFRIDFQETREPKSCSLEQRKTSLPRSDDSLLTILAGSHMARTRVTPKAFILKNSSNIFAAIRRSMEQMRRTVSVHLTASRHDFSAIFSRSLGLRYNIAGIIRIFGVVVCTLYSLYIQYHATNIA